MAKEGYLKDWICESDLEKLMIEKHSWNVYRAAIYSALEKLVKDGYLGKKKMTKGVGFKLSDFVTFEE